MSVSAFRANSIKSYLAGKGVNPSNLTAQGLGPKNPIASNDTQEGREQNRRVEIEPVAVTRCLPSTAETKPPLEKFPGLGVERQPSQFLRRHPPGIGRVPARTRVSLHVVGQQIDDDIVKTDASVRIGLDDVEDETRLSGLNDDPGFLEQFSLRRLLQRFPDFDTSARDGPLALGRWLPAPDEQYAAVLENNGANRQTRTIRIAFRVC